MSDSDDEVQRKRYKQLVEQRERNQQIKSHLLKVLDSEAYGRISNLSHHGDGALYLKVASAIIQYSKQIDRKIKDEELKQLLVQLTQKPETKIQFKRK